MDDIGKAQSAQKLTAGFRDDADGWQLADVDAGGLDQKPVHRRVEERVVGHVIDVAVMIVVEPTRRNGPQSLELASRVVSVGHNGPLICQSLQPRSFSFALTRGMGWRLAPTRPGT